MRFEEKISLLTVPNEYMKGGYMDSKGDQRVVSVEKRRLLYRIYLSPFNFGTIKLTCLSCIQFSRVHVLRSNEARIAYSHHTRDAWRRQKDYGNYRGYKQHASLCVQVYYNR